MNTLADPCSAMAGNAVSQAPVLEAGEPSRTRMVRPAASPTRRGRVVEAGRVTTVAGMVFAEFARAVTPAPPMTPRRPESDPRLTSADAEQAS